MLHTDSHADEWRARVLVDLGSGSASSGVDPGPNAVFPGPAAQCAEPSRTYLERWIPVGTRVEVLACHDGTSLRACPGAPIEAVLAIPTLARHRARRAEAALAGLRLFAGGATIAILLVFFVTLAGKNAVLRGITPARRRG